MYRYRYTVQKSRMMYRYFLFMTIECSQSVHSIALQAENSLHNNRMFAELAPYFYQFLRAGC